MLYRFNNIEIDTNNYSLLDKGKEISVEPQVFNLIVYLIKNKNKVVSRNEILEKLWQGRIVSDTSINNHIKSARKVLGDDGVKQTVIKTIHSRGYQFIADTNDPECKPKARVKSKKYKSITILFLIFSILLFGVITLYQRDELRQSVQKIANYQEISYATFIAQAKRRNELVAMLEKRLGTKRIMQFEKFFSYHFKELNNEEKFVFHQIRAMTESGLYQNNLKIILELNNHPEIFSRIAGTKELHKHLTFWLNKYHSVFTKRQDMCLLYVGVEDDMAYPSDVNRNIKNWLDGVKTDGIKKTTKIENNQESNDGLQEKYLPNINSTSIAVLPFANTKPDENTDFLGFALANQIISDLTTLNKFTILPAGTIRKYANKDIDPLLEGKELKVSYVLTGNYLKENNIIRLNVELIEVANNKLIWSESIQVDYSNAFALQDMVAQKVAKGLNVNLKNNFFDLNYIDIPKSPLAYEYYLRAIAYPYTNKGHKMAIDMLEKSIELDSTYAPAYAHLGSHLRLYEQHGYVKVTRNHDVQWYYQEALKLNPNLLLALKNLATYYTETNRVEKAFVLAKRMQKINPNSVDTHFTLSYIYRYAGINDKAIEEIEAALQLSPNNPRLGNIIVIYMGANMPHKALEYLSIASRPYGNIHGGIIEFNLGNINKAKTYFQKLINDKEGGIWELHANFYLALISQDLQLAKSYLHKMEQGIVVDGENYYHMATSYALVLNIQKSLMMLEKAIDNGYFNYPYFDITPEFRVLYNLPKYKEILNKAKQRHDSFREMLF